MALTNDEIQALKTAHFAISHMDCFGTNDVMTESRLGNKASRYELEKVCPKCYDEEC